MDVLPAAWPTKCQSIERLSRCTGCRGALFVNGRLNGSDCHLETDTEPAYRVWGGSLDDSQRAHGEHRRESRRCAGGRGSLLAGRNHARRGHRSVRRSAQRAAAPFRRSTGEGAAGECARSTNRTGGTPQLAHAAARGTQRREARHDSTAASRSKRTATMKRRESAVQAASFSVPSAGSRSSRSARSQSSSSAPGSPPRASYSS